MERPPALAPPKPLLSLLGEDMEQLSLIPSSQVGLGTKGPVSRQPPPTRHHHITRLSTLPTTGGCRGRDARPLPQLKSFSWGHRVGKTMG